MRDAEADDPPRHLIRLFVALELPEAARDALARWQAELLGAQPLLRAVGRDSLHATLCFLGMRPHEEVRVIVGACELAGGMTGPALSLGDVRWLPSPRRPRVVAVTLVDGHDELASLHTTLSRSLAQAGVLRPERRRFLGHVTVARMPSAQRVTPTSPPPLPSLAFRSRSFALYRSHLGPGPAQYELLHRIALARAE